MIRVIKTKEKSKKQQMMLRFAAFVLALCAGGLFLLILGNNPFAIYGTIISGAFRSEMAVQATVKIMIPLLITALGVTLAFKMRFWNIGGEGQLIMGGMFASYFALFHADWPGFVLFPVMFLGKNCKTTQSGAQNGGNEGKNHPFPAFRPEPAFPDRHAQEEETGNNGRHHPGIGRAQGHQHQIGQEPKDTVPNPPVSPVPVMINQQCVKKRRQQGQICQVE